MILVTRRESGKDRYYTAAGTGNFNEDTASIFADHLLFTYNQGFGTDAAAIFSFFEKSYHPPKLDHLKVAPFHLRNFLREKIEQEIANHAAGKSSGISVKVNNLSDIETINLINRAANEGVKVRLIVRSMFSLVVNDEDPIEAISIVDKYLEHSRMMFFDNDGDPQVFLSSADFLPRNFDTRVETIIPIYDNRIRNQLIDYFEIQWRDNTKARILDHDLTNHYRKKGPDEAPCRSQCEIEDYLRDLV